jgi:hypothetical protein
MPSLANGKSAISIFSGLVQRHSAGVFHGDDDDTRLLIIGSTARRRWCLRVGAIFLDADMGDVGLVH